MAKVKESLTLFTVLPLKPNKRVFMYYNEPIQGDMADPKIAELESWEILGSHLKYLKVKCMELVTLDLVNF